jgi:glycosyltransferase involved in cell wall biosynthesis
MKEQTSVLVLNWNEMEISKDSVRLLLKEPGVLEVILIDQNSNDGSKEHFSTIKDKKFKLVQMPENKGASVGRNAGLDVSKGKYIFLLDGDILFVKGSIKEYEKVLEKHPEAYCVGQNSLKLLNELGHNGVYDIMEADLSMGTNYKVENWFPMAWTQYGLFKGDLLRKVKFVTEGAFGEASYGFEDDYYHHDMKSLGYESLSISLPIYYHFAHSGWRELEKAKVKDKMDERKQIFEKRWGKGKAWWENMPIKHDE